MHSLIVSRQDLFQGQGSILCAQDPAALLFAWEGFAAIYLAYMWFEGKNFPL